MNLYFSLLGHILGEFYLTQLETNKASIKSVLKYCGCFVLFSLIGIPRKDDLCITFCFSILISLLFLFMKKNQTIISERMKSFTQTYSDAGAFLLIHSVMLAMIWIMSKLLPSDHAPAWIALFSNEEDILVFFKVILSVLICAIPASEMVHLILKGASKTTNHLNITGTPGVPVGGGRLIGVLEREIIILLAIMNQYGAIAYVLTAKSVARFKQMENQDFAEKYLIGTLSSTLIALLCAISIM